MRTVPLKYLATLAQGRYRSQPAPIITLDLIEPATGAPVGDPWAKAYEPPTSGVVDVERGDVLLGKLRPYLAKVLLAKVQAYASTELLCLRPRPGIDSLWLAYKLLSRPVTDWAVATSVGTKMPRTSWDRLGELTVTLPNEGQQGAIGGFLDAETARIDALITRKRRIVDLGKERMVGTIGHYLSTDQASQLPLRRIAAFVDYRGATPEKAANGVPLITAAHVGDGVLDGWRDPQYISDDAYEAWMRRGWPFVGDVLLTTEAPLGRVAQIEDENVALAQRIILLKCDPSRIRSDYLFFALRSPLFQQNLRSHATGSTALGIKADRLKALLVPVPGLDRQEEIAAKLHILEVGNHRICNTVARQTALLREHRQALITAAVAGEMKVPGVEA